MDPFRCLSRKGRSCSASGTASRLVDPQEVCKAYHKLLDRAMEIANYLPWSNFKYLPQSNLSPYAHVTMTISDDGMMTLSWPSDEIDFPAFLLTANDHDISVWKEAEERRRKKFEKYLRTLGVQIIPGGVGDDHSR